MENLQEKNEYFARQHVGISFSLESLENSLARAVALGKIEFQEMVPIRDHVVKRQEIFLAARKAIKQ